LAAKVDAVAADIKAHRADTEAHYPVYRVKE
jgi:outer membrane murein-binding lipoprotein Lpp